MPQSLANSSLGLAFVAQSLDNLLPFALMLAGLAAWVLFREKRPLRTLGFQRAGAVSKYLAGVACGAVLYLLLTVAAVATGAVQLSQALEPGPYTLLLVLLGFAGIAVQSGAEEVLLRGWQLPVIAVRHGLPAAILLSSLVFTAVHLIADVSSVYVYGFIFAFAILLSLVALYTESLWVVCGLHAAWNWLDTNVFAAAGAQGTFSTSLYSYSPAGTGDLYVLLNIAVITAGILVLLALLVLKGRRTAGLSSEAATRSSP